MKAFRIFTSSYLDGYMSKTAADPIDFGKAPGVDALRSKIPNRPADSPAGWKFDIRKPTRMNKDFTTAYSLSGPDRAFDSRLTDKPSSFKSVKGLPTVGVHGHGGGFPGDYSVAGQKWPQLMEYVKKAIPPEGEYALNVDACNLQGGCHPDLQKAMKDSGHLRWEGRVGHWVKTKPPKYVSRAPAFTVGHHPNIDAPEPNYPAFDYKTGLPASDEDYRNAARYYGRNWKMDLNLPGNRAEREAIQDGMVKKNQPYKEVQSIADYWSKPENAARLDKGSPIKTSVYPDSSLNDEWRKMVDKYKAYIGSKADGTTSGPVKPADWKKFIADYTNMARSENFSRLGGPAKIWLQEGEEPGNTQSRSKLFHRSDERAKAMGISSMFTEEERAGMNKALAEYDRLRQKLPSKRALAVLYYKSPELFKLVHKALKYGMTIAKKENSSTQRSV